MSFRHGAIALASVIFAFAGCAAESGSDSGSGGSGGSAGSGGSLSSGGSSGSGGTTSGTGGTGAGGTAGGGSGGTGATTGDACETCFEANCGSEWAACEASADCMSLLTCLEGCADETCDNQCFTTHAAGAPVLDAVDACQGTKCASECGGSTGGDPCDTCVETKCGTPLNACLNDPACTAFWDCLEPCTDVACEDACVAQHPNGVAKSDAVDLCVDQQCLAECGGA